MHLEIVSPEATLFSGEVNSVTVPGIDGEFQMLNNHAAIVSLLKAGKVRFDGDITIEEEYEDRFSTDEKGKMVLEINSGTVEMNNNKVIVLAD